MTTSDEDPKRAIFNAINRLSRLASIRPLDANDVDAELVIIEASLEKLEVRPASDRWFVVRKRDVEPIEVYSFDRESDAREFYDRAQVQWSECFLTLVVLPTVPE